jgi:hypothetical protein
VLSVKQTPERDEINIDMAPAYLVSTLKTLTRSMRHERGSEQKAASISIEDRFEFISAQSFEVALTTLGTWKQEAPDRISFTRNGQTLQAQIEASAPCEIKEESVDEEGIKFTRLGIRLATATATGFVRVTYRAAEK